MTMAVAVDMVGRTSTPPGMTLILNPGKMLKVKMSIDLCGGDARMPKQFLNRRQAAPDLQHMAGKGVAQQVWMQALVGTLHHAPAGQAGLDTALAQATAPLADEYRGFTLVSHGCSVRQPLVQSRDGFAADRQNALLVTFTQNTHLPAFQVQGGQAQASQFCQTEARRVHQLEHGEVADFQGVVRIDVQQLADLVNVCHFRQPAPAFGSPNIQSGVIPGETFPKQELIETADGRQVPGNAPTA